MDFFLQARGFDVWKAIVNGYKAPASPLIDKDEKKLCENNSKAMTIILSGLINSTYVKLVHCDSTKEIWDKLQNVYEGYAKVKGAKLQTYRGQFEQLKMKTKIVQLVLCELMK
jgi:hypothetical protein